MQYLREVFRMIREEVAKASAMDFSQVRFERLRWALVAAALLGFVFLWKYFISRNKDNLQGSGYFLRRERQDPAWKRIVYASAKPFLAVSSALLLVALAVPYVERYSKEKTVESREVCYLEDVSASMGWEFGSSGISAAQVARDALLRHLRQRSGYHDKSCFWVFAQRAYKIEDFTTDDKSFAFQVYSAPHIAASPDHPILPWVDGQSIGVNMLKAIVPREKILFRDGEGGTNLALALQKNAEYFRKYGDKGFRHRALLIITDAAVNEFPTKELESLGQMGVEIYLIYIEPNERGLLSSGGVGVLQLENAKRLIDEISRYGGKAFNIQSNTGDKRVLDQVFAEIHRLQPKREKVVQKVEREYVFQRLLFPAILVGIISILFGCFVEVFWGSRI